MPRTSVQTMRARHVLRLLLFGVCSIQAVMAPLGHRPQPPSPKNAVVHDLSESSVSECVKLCDAHMAYTYAYGM